MNQAIGNPDELDAFAHSLQAYLDQINDATGHLNQQFGALGDTWQDAQRGRFEEQFEDLLRRISAFDSNVSEQIPYLRAMADDLRHYLQR